MSSLVVQYGRVRGSSINGVFWMAVGHEGKNVALLLEHLANRLARVPADKLRRCPDRLGGAEKALLHLSAVHVENDLMCLVASDHVRDVEVVNAFASTGFHVLLTTGKRTTVISLPFTAHCGRRSGTCRRRMRWRSCTKRI